MIPAKNPTNFSGGSIKKSNKKNKEYYAVIEKFNYVYFIKSLGYVLLGIFVLGGLLSFFSIMIIGLINTSHLQIYINPYIILLITSLISAIIFIMLMDFINNPEEYFYEKEIKLKNFKEKKQND